MMDDATSRALRREFGYVPDEKGGEQWVVYRDHTLIVIHPEQKPRLYERGRGHDGFYEIEPLVG